MTGTPQNPYEVLGLSPRASRDDVARAYRIQARRLHPDTREAHGVHEAVEADDALRRVIAAFTLLSDPARRAEYDRAARPETRGTAVRVVRHPQRLHDPPPTDSPPIVAGPVLWWPRHNA